MATVSIPFTEQQLILIDRLVAKAEGTRGSAVSTALAAGVGADLLELGKAE